MLKTLVKKLPLLGALIGVATLALATNAAAHVVVSPAEATTASWQTFTVGVPNEKAIPTTGVKLVIPEGLNYVQPTQKAGWKIDTETDGPDESAVVKSITWSGNEVKVGFRDEFSFSAQVPADETELQWKAYQTYQDGSVVAWDKAGSDDSHDDTADSGPFSVTKVVADSATDSAIQKSDQAAASAKTAAARALYVGIAGVVVGLVAVYFATRSK